MGKWFPVSMLLQAHTVFPRAAWERLRLLTGRRGLEQEVPCRIRIWMQVRLIHSCINS